MTFREVLFIAPVLQVSEDGRYVLLSIREGCDPVNRLWYCDLETIPQGITGMVFLILNAIMLFNFGKGTAVKFTEPFHHFFDTL